MHSMLFLIVHSFSFMKAFNVTVPERTLQITDGKPRKQLVPANVFGELSLDVLLCLISPLGDLAGPGWKVGGEGGDFLRPMF